jgi:hypothetical protein
MPGCDGSVPTKLKAFLTLQMLVPGKADMSPRASVVRYASFLWTSEGSVQNSVKALAMEQGMPKSEASA